MKKLVVIALIAVAFGWYFVQGSRLSEEQVREYYQDVTRATLDRKPEDLCSLLADNFSATGTVYVGTQSSPVTQNKTQACEMTKKTYAMWKAMGDKMGGLLYLDFGLEIHNITISPDKKTATVDISYSMDVSGTIMQIRSKCTETLIRKFGKVRELHSEFQQSMSSAF